MRRWVVVDRWEGETSLSVSATAASCVGGFERGHNTTTTASSMLFPCQAASAVTLVVPVWWQAGCEVITKPGRCGEVGEAREGGREGGGRDGERRGG